MPSFEEVPEVHCCGKCGGKWKTDAEYLNHKCKITSFKPTDPKHLGPQFAKVQTAALARGEAKKEPEQLEN